MCKLCEGQWCSMKPEYLERFHDVIRDMFPARVEYNKCIDKSIISSLRRGKKSMQDLAQEISRFANERYELCQKQYLSLTAFYRERNSQPIKNLYGKSDISIVDIRRVPARREKSNVISRIPIKNWNSTDW